MLGDLPATVRCAEEGVRQIQVLGVSTCYRALIVAHWRLGREAEAREAVHALLRIAPGTRVGRMTDVWRDRAFRDAYWADLRAAGVPE
jgi:hypothetical protein